MESPKLPTRWKIDRLSRYVALLESGRRPRGGVSKYTSGVPSISAQQITDNGSFNWNSIKYVPEEFYRKTGKGHIQKYDILIVKDGATTGKCAFVGDDFPFPDAMVNEHTFILRTTRDLCPKYVFYYLKSPYCAGFFGSARERGVIGGLTNDFPAKIRLPIPSYEEQKRIVLRIDRIMALVNDARKIANQAIIEVRDLFLSKLESLVRELNLTQCFMPLGSVLIGRPRNGWSPPADTISDRGTPVLTLSAVTGFDYDGSKVKWTNANTKPNAHYWLTPGELLVSRSNTRELVGHAAIYDGTPSPCICPDLIMKMSVDPKKADVRFIHYWMQSRTVRNYIMQKARGTSGSMKKISQKDVQNIPVPTISVGEQQRIADYLDKFRTRAMQIRRLQYENDEALSVFVPALLFRAFSGEF